MPEAAYPLPEFTRSLRALAQPAAPGSPAERAFAPLLQARTAAHRVSSLEGQLAAFDPAKLERAWREQIAAIAVARHRKSPPDQRALAAELEALAAPLWKALADVGRAAHATRHAGPEARRDAWELWVYTLQQLFACADDWWRHAAPHAGGPA